MAVCHHIVFIGGKEMLVSAEKMLLKAKEGKYAVGQFNINNLEWAKAILLTAQDELPCYPRRFRGCGKVYVRI